MHYALPVFIEIIVPIYTCKFEVMYANSHCCVYILFFNAAVMRSDGFEYLKENCPGLQSEILKTVAHCEDECSSGGGGSKSRSVCAQLSDGGDANGRRVRQRT